MTLNKTARRYSGTSWRGWVVGFGRLWVDFRTGVTYGDRILTITWDRKKKVKQ